MISPALSHSAPLTPAFTPALALAPKPPITPGGATARAIDANLGFPPMGNPLVGNPLAGIPPVNTPFPGLPPVGTPLPANPQQRAQAALDFSHRWDGVMTRLADSMGVNLGGSLRFANYDEKRIGSALERGAPDAQLSRATDRLVGDWANRGPAIFQRLRFGTYRNAEQSFHQIASNLASAGVNSPQLQIAFRDASSLLRGMDAAGLPGNSAAGWAQLQNGLHQVLTHLGDAASAYVRNHPENLPVVQGTMQSAMAALSQMSQGLFTVSTGMTALQGELNRLGGGGALPAPPPPGTFPPPTPLPWPGNA